MPHSRLFFALWPSPALARELHTLARHATKAHGGRVMRLDTLHLTLAFLGNTPDSRIEAIAARGADCARACQPFTLTLDELGYWPRKHIVWAGPRIVPSPLVQLAGALSSRLGDAVQDRRFNPHVTLVRRAGAAPDLPPPALCWNVDALCLVRSATEAAGARYTIIGHWPLGA